MDEHAVLIHLPQINGFGPISRIDDALADALSDSQVGEYDGHEVDAGTATFYLYGPDADRLLDTIRDALFTSDLPNGTYAIKRYGPPGADEVAVRLV